MHGKVLAVLICLLPLAGFPPAILAQCADADRDGYFYESVCGTLEDCNDAAAGIYPGAMESCDGYDNDCDGLIDNDPVCVTSCPAQYQMVGDHIDLSAVSSYQSLVWNGSQYGIAWPDDRTGSTRVYFARLDVLGNKIGGDTELAPGSRPSLVWTGSEYAVAYHLHPTGVFFQRVDASGNPIGDAAHVAQSGHSPSLAWTGAEFGLAWRSDGIRFVRLDAVGQEIPESQVAVYDAGGASTDPTSWPELVWNGNGYGVGYILNAWVVGSWWADYVYFQALDSDGNLIGTPQDLSGEQDVDIGIHPSIAWSGSEFGVTWHDGIHILFARVDSNGNQIGSTVIAAGPVSVQALWPDMTWTGGEYGVAWNSITSSHEYQVYLTRLDSSGAEINELLQVTDVYDTGPPVLAWTGTEYGIAWGGFLSQADEGGIYFTRLVCGPCIDHDGDDFTACDECDDGDDRIYPAAYQLCDGINNDCDDSAWPAVPADELDADSDSYRPCSGDCDESDPARHPDATELCDGIDNDCSGEVDDADLDLDGVRDCVDRCLGLFNPLQLDSDSDGVGELCDLCPFVPDPDQADMDGDGRGDACDCQPIDPGDREPAEVRGLRIGPSGEDSWLLEWTAAPGADAYSISRGDLAALGQNSYGACLAEGMPALTFEDSSAPAPGEGLVYLVQGQNFDCGLGPLGWTSEEQPRENPGAGACDGYPHTDLHAVGESNVYGTATGSYADTFASDDTREAIVEELSGGNPDNRFSRLEHRWTFDLTPGGGIELHVEGDRSSSTDGDDFHFEYSTDGGTSWNPIAIAPLPLSDYGSDSVADLPADLSGAMILRVIDSDRTPGNQTLDTVRIDELFVRIIP